MVVIERDKPAVFIEVAVYQRHRAMRAQVESDLPDRLLRVRRSGQPLYRCKPRAVGDDIQPLLGGNGIKDHLSHRTAAGIAGTNK